MLVASVTQDMVPYIVNPQPRILVLILLVWKSGWSSSAIAVCFLMSRCWRAIIRPNMDCLIGVVSLCVVGTRCIVLGDMMKPMLEHLTAVRRRR